MEWLMKMLGAGQQGGGQFGSMGGGVPMGGLLSAAGGPMSLIGALGGNRGSSAPVPNPNTGDPIQGTPMSGLGPGSTPGAPLNLTPTNPAGLWNPQGQSGGQQAALGQAMNLIKQPQLQPAPWMQMMPMGTMRG